MNTRERFLKSCHFEGVDQAPSVEIGAWPQTRVRRFQEGMPRDADTDFTVLKRATYFGLEDFDKRSGEFTQRLPCG